MALLFATCTEVGAISVGADQEKRMRLFRFGEFVGMCNQIRNDISDFYQNFEISNPTGSSIANGKVTLPLLHALQNTVGEEKESVIALIQTKEFTPKNIEVIRQFTRKMGGVEYSKQKMNEFKAVGTYAVVAANSMFARKFVEMIV